MQHELLAVLRNDCVASCLVDALVYKEGILVVIVVKRIRTTQVTRESIFWGGSMIWLWKVSQGDGTPPSTTPHVHVPVLVPNLTQCNVDVWSVSAMSLFHLLASNNDLRPRWQTIMTCCH